MQLYMVLEVIITALSFLHMLPNSNDTQSARMQVTVLLPTCPLAFLRPEEAEQSILAVYFILFLPPPTTSALC